MGVDISLMFYTEQGIAMLSAVLKSDIAIAVSIRIMESFVEMRKYMTDFEMFYLVYIYSQS